jgi:hypothetical protein
MSIGSLPLRRCSARNAGLLHRALTTCFPPSLFPCWHKLRDCPQADLVIECAEYLTVINAIVGCQPYSIDMFTWNPGERKMTTTQFDGIVEDAKRRAKEEMVEYLERQNGSTTVIDRLIKAVVDVHANKQLDEPTIQKLLVLLSCIERLNDDLLAWAKKS